MTKNSTNSSSSSSSSESLGVCEKLFIAIKVSPAFQTIRRISHRPRNPTPPPPLPSPPVVQNGHFTPRTIQILNIKPASSNHDHEEEISSTANPHENKEVVIEGTVDKKPQVRIDHHDHDHDDEHYRLNKRFSEYINRAGTKIRTVPDADHHHHGHDEKKSDGDYNQKEPMVMKKKESFKDQVSDYMHRAKAKIKSPSSATGKTFSFKTE